MGVADCLARTSSDGSSGSGFHGSAAADRVHRSPEVSEMVIAVSTSAGIPGAAYSPASSLSTCDSAFLTVSHDTHRLLA